MTFFTEIIILFESLLVLPSSQASALVFSIIFFVLAFILHLLFDDILMKLSSYFRSKSSQKLIVLLRNPAVYTVLAVGVFGAFTILFSQFIELFNRILSTILLVLWAIFSIKIILFFLETLKNKKTKARILHKEVLPFFEKLVKITLIIVAFFMFLRVWKINIFPLLTSAGLAAVMLAFAARESISNILGGIAIYIDRTYEIGNYIRTSEGDRGLVVDVSLRTTKIRTRDNLIVTIPNSLMANAKVINETIARGSTRFAIKFSVTYDTDIVHLDSVLNNIKGVSIIAKSPKPHLRFRKFGDSGVEFEYLFYIKDPEFKGRAVDIMGKKLYKEFIKENIEFAFPHRKLVFKEGFNKNS